VRVLITGVCGFVGSALARYFRERRDAASLEIIGIDNFSRSGSETNRHALARLGINVVHGDVRLSTDVEACGAVDWIIDAAANPSVLAGIDGRTSSRQLIDNNLTGTINLVEHCKTVGAGLVLLSTSRVYSIPPLAAMPVRVERGAFWPDLDAPTPASATGHRRRFFHHATLVTLRHEQARVGNDRTRVRPCVRSAGLDQSVRRARRRRPVRPRDAGNLLLLDQRALARRGLSYIGFAARATRCATVCTPPISARLC
jgi:hypothetical protein